MASPPPPQPQAAAAPARMDQQQQPDDGPTVLDELLREGLLETGDLVLFSRRCETMGVLGCAVCLAAKLYGRYDHLGVVVRGEEEPGGGSSSLRLLDAGFNGVQCVDLRERVRRSKAHDIAVRRLHVARTPGLEAAARAYAKEVTGQSYKQGFFQMLASGVVTPAQWRREKLYEEVRRLEGRVRQLTRELRGGHQQEEQEERGRALMTPLERAALERALATARSQRDAATSALAASEVSVFENREDLGSGLFCSELAASLYQRLGLLPRYPSSNSYIPMDFASSSGAVVAGLRREKGLEELLQGGAHLGEEVLLKRHGRELRAGSVVNREQEEGRGTAVAGTAQEEEKGPEAQQVIARALRRYGPTSGMVGPSSESDGAAQVLLPKGLLSRFHRASFRPGQLIDAFPSPAAKATSTSSSGGLYVIAEGEVELYRQWAAPTPTAEGIVLPPPAPELVATLGPGQAFGGPEAGLVARAAQGSKGVRVWRAAGLGATMEPPVRPRTRAERARVLSVLEHHPYFQGLGRRQREAAVGHFFAVDVRKGETVLAQGQRGDNMYILDRGRAEIVRRKGSSHESDAVVVVAASVNPGAVFGEAAVLFNSRRGASVTALEDCRLWALGRMDAMALTGRGPPFSLLDFFRQHASVSVIGEEERYMSYDDFCRALRPSSSSAAAGDGGGRSSSPPPVRLLLRALDPTSRGLVSFSELVHLDVWLNSPQAALEVALRLAGRDAGFEALTLADWAALREAARRDMGGSKEEEMEEGEDARFVARTFGVGAGKRRGGRGRGLLASFRKMSGTRGEEAEASLEDVSTSVPYDDFVRALQSPGCPRVVRRYLEAIEGEVALLRARWASQVEQQERRLLRRATTVVRAADGGLPYRRQKRQQQDEAKEGDDVWAWARDKHLLALVVSGGVAGAVARMAVAPLERAKILIQTSPRPLTLRDAIRLMLDPRYGRPPWGGAVYSATRGLLVGNGLNMLRILPVLATQAYLYHFLAHRVLKPPTPPFPFVSPPAAEGGGGRGKEGGEDPAAWALTLGTGAGTGAGIQAAEEKRHQRQQQQQAWGQASDPTPPAPPLPLEAKHMLAGGVAGVAANLLVHPLDTVRARITAQTTAMARPYSGGAWDCARRLVAEEGGWRALWRGALPCSLWAFLYIGIHSTCLAVLAPLSLQSFSSSPFSSSSSSRRLLANDGGEKQRRRARGVALASAVGAGVVAQAVAYPFDLVRRRMQLTGAGGPGMWATARAAMMEYSGTAVGGKPKLRLRGLYRGFPVLLLKLLPTALVSFRVSSALLERLEE